MPAPRTVRTTTEAATVGSTGFDTDPVIDDLVAAAGSLGSASSDEVGRTPCFVFARGFRAQP